MQHAFVSLSRNGFCEQFTFVYLSWNGVMDEAYFWLGYTYDSERDNETNMRKGSMNVYVWDMVNSELMVGGV